MNREFLTFPQPVIDNSKSKDIIADAISKADEIWWASAYLTNWPLSHNCIPKRTCSSCNIVIGSDFGITRRAALTSLLNWSRRTICNVYINESNGFHPKALIWKIGRKYFALIGSSNLSIAAWSSNIELNVVVVLSETEYKFLTTWFQDVVIGESDLLDLNWIKYYNECKRKPKADSKPITDIDRRIKELGKVDSTFPKRQYKVYQEKRSQFIQIVNSCANGEISGQVFYDKMWMLLADSWYGSPGWCRTCKKENWKQACKGLANIFSANDSERDRVVKETIDALEKSNNPIRGAWLSEILCHHYPFSYPLVNDPVKSWIRKIGISKIRGVPDGNTYLKITLRMRKILSEHKKLFNGFGEMDHAIWEKSKKNK